MSIPSARFDAPHSEAVLPRLASYFAIYVIWGTTYFFIKEAVGGVTPLSVVALRFLAGGLLLLAIARVKGERFGSPREMAGPAVSGLFLLLGANGLVTWAEKYVDSYYAALMISVSPILLILVDRLVVKKPVPRGALIGIPFGILGVLLLVLPGRSVGGALPWQIGLLFLAMLSWAIGSALGKVLPRPEGDVMPSAIQLTVTGLVASLFFLARDGSYTPVHEFIAAPLRAQFAIVYLAVLGSLALVAYNYLLHREPMGKIASYTLVNPVIAVLVGMWVGHERATPLLLPAMAGILAGVGMVFYGESLGRWARARWKGVK
jgi:drug/metabolite transporter (DMT)-like permease